MSAAATALFSLGTLASPMMPISRSRSAGTAHSALDASTMLLKFCSMLEAASPDETVTEPLFTGWNRAVQHRNTMGTPASSPAYSSTMHQSRQKARVFAAFVYSVLAW